MTSRYILIRYMTRKAKTLKLSDYAKKVGVHWRTANRWFHNGQIPGAYQLPSGTIIVPDEGGNKANDGITVVYARVSNSNRRETDLDTQAKRLVDYAIANGWTVDKVIKEVGSGLNDKRKQLDNLLRSNKQIKRIIIEHKDRLTRFGFNYLDILSDKMGFEIIIVNPTQDDKEDLLEDLINIITSFCARIYGQRRGKRETEKLTKELTNAID